MQYAFHSVSNHSKCTNAARLPNARATSPFHGGRCEGNGTSVLEHCRWSLIGNQSEKSVRVGRSVPPCIHYHDLFCGHVRRPHQRMPRPPVGGPINAPTHSRPTWISRPIRPGHEDVGGLNIVTRFDREHEDRGESRKTAEVRLPLPRHAYPKPSCLCICNNRDKRE